MKFSDQSYNLRIKLDTKGFELPAGEIKKGDYAAFRKLMFVYEEPLRNRIGRWIERYPEVAAQLDEQVYLEDIVEEVFLTAFDEYDDRPQAVPFGE